MTKTQQDQVLQHLKKKKSITSWEAITLYHITRLADVILKLRSKNIKIASMPEQRDGKRWVRYVLMKL
jgi:hypothetical protein